MMQHVVSTCLLGFILFYFLSLLKQQQTLIFEAVKGNESDSRNSKNSGWNPPGIGGRV